ncbi:gamma-glutamylcyclotransferase family protein [Tropicibacter sp. S64]|uniref:gamma-glutamylcyclotransferase family protein n=1 Tax=Tropicibacter sp. S64 TaxID=3415122 RepID=UPI003C79B8EC
MSDAYFFGYGSLVNTQTHGFAPVYRAKATGWRRGWRYTAARKVAYLTAIRAPGESIDGLIAAVPGEDWAALDAREAAYDRIRASHEITHAANATEIAIYAIAPDRLRMPDAEHPVLLSYLEVVLQGYLRVYGEAGAQAFIDTTDGWEAPFLDDRATPVYARAQTLTADEKAFVFDALRALDCRVLVP